MMGAFDPMLASIDDQMVRELAMRGRVRTFPKNSLIINQGDRGDAMYVVLAGQVQVYVSDARGREMILDDRGPGELFGEMALDGSPRSASVRSLETVTCAVVDADTLRESLRDPDMALQLIFVLIERARAATESVMSLALSDVYGRVRALLMAMAEAPAGDGVRTIPQRMTQQYIASRVGAQRDMVSRVCSQLVRGGYIAVTDRQYAILKPLPERF
jgi:CRP/FNR family cyclic AMP-dependent transcriptional regulator